MIDHLVDALNKDCLSFCIADLYEENDTDYLLLIIEKEVAIAVEVIYSGKSVSFSRLCQSKRNHITSIFAERFKAGSHNEYQTLV